jgi:signal peptidase I
LIAFFLFLLFRSNFALCPIHSKQEVVHGNSLSGIVEDGDKVVILFGYYGCRVPVRGDVAAVNYAGNKYPLIKVIKGVPGDVFALEPGAGGQMLLINHQPARTTQGVPYVFSEQKARVFSLYIRDHQGVIPDNAYLVLGNLPDGTVDSSQFGLIDRASLLGRVQL